MYVHIYISTYICVCTNKSNIQTFYISDTCVEINLLTDLCVYGSASLVALASHCFCHFSAANPNINFPHVRLHFHHIWGFP